MPNLAIEAIAEGLKPRPHTFPVDLATIRAAERLRLVAAAERQTELMEASLAAQQRLADAAERQANALEIVAGLFASCVGVTNAWCPNDANEAPTINFLRTSSDGKPFRCDQTEGDDDED
jgi:hypothetical protein